MSELKGALTLAEGNPAFVADADIIFNNGKDKKEFVLRTTFDDIDVWKAKHGVSISPFRAGNVGAQKWVARIEKDYWVFGVNATNANDIFTAVKIGMTYYKAKASDLISDIYVKNLNVENENQLLREALVKANQKLYEDVCRAIVQAAKLLGVSGMLNFYVFSNNKNFKVPKDDLHVALKNGGADSIETDAHPYKFSVGSNDGKRVFENLISHMHLAKLKV
jgi:hypothetical protein